MLSRLALVLFAFVVACVPTVPDPEALAPDGPPRVVSLAPAITETLAAIGAREVLVGRSDYCDTPADVRTVPAFGSALTPDLEGLVGVRPQRVFVEDAQGVDVETLRKVVPVEALPWLTLEEIQASTRRLGVYTGREVQAEQLASELGQALTPVAGADAPRVLLVIGSTGPAGDIWYIKPNSLHGSALLAAGGQNAVPGPVDGAPSTTIERVLKLDPEVIVLLESRSLTKAEEQAAIARWQAVQPLRAVQGAQVHVLAAPGLLSTGPSIRDFVTRLTPLLAEPETP